MYLIFVLGCFLNDKDTSASQTVIDLSKFNTSCEIDDDCQAVGSGDVCGCFCGGGAINASDAQAFDDAVMELRGNCDPDEMVDCFMCPNFIAQCEDGTCTSIQQDTE